MREAESMRALAERCEKATGPDRELDALIRETLNPAGYRKEQRVTYYGEATGEHAIDGHFVKSPAYTASLDAALTLVPEGAVWGISCDDERPGLFRATVMPLRPPDQTRYCATPALALTAASLRALITEDRS